MKLLLGVLFSILLSGCYAFHELPITADDSGSAVIGKVAQRVGWCVASAWCLCASEWLFIPEAVARHQEDLNYWRWRSTLSPAEQQQEHERELLRIQAAGRILQGFAVQPIIPGPSGPAYTLTPVPAYVPSSRPLNCLTDQWGTSLYTTCY